MCWWRVGGRVRQCHGRRAEHTGEQRVLVLRQRRSEELGLPQARARHGAGHTHAHTHTLTRARALVRPGPAPAFVPVAHTGHRWSLPTPQLGCFCLSEPNAGSDAFALTTRAEDKGDHWLINGNKMWITNSGEAGLFLVRAVVTGLRLIAVHACRRV